MDRDKPNVARASFVSEKSKKILQKKANSAYKDETKWNYFTKNIKSVNKKQSKSPK
jgi:hypothetical protein